MKSYRSSEIIPILSFLDNGVFLSKNGSLSVCFCMENPEAYTLNKERLQVRAQEFFRAFKGMPENSTIHKQDLFVRRSFDPTIIEGDSFFSTSDREYFKDTPYLDHQTIITFSINGLGSLSSSYIKNPLAYNENLLKGDKEKLDAFFEAVKGAVVILNSLFGTSVRQLEKEEVKRHLYNSVNGYFEDNFIRDVEIGETINIGGKKGGFLTICDVNYLPDEISTAIKDDSLKGSLGDLYSSFCEKLGIHLPFTHIVNQVWTFSRQYKEEFSKTVGNFRKHRNFDKDILQDYEELDALETEIKKEGNIIVSTHFNVFVLEDESRFELCTNAIKSFAQNSGCSFYIPTFEGLKEIFLGSLIGNACKMNSNYMFLCDLKSSLCLSINESTFKQDESGIFFNDRLYNVPLRVDMWFGRKEHKLPARNIIFIAGTGGGKSVTAGNMIQQYIDSGYKIIVVEFGKSFYPLTQIYKEKSLHVDYKEDTALGIDAFNIVGKPNKEKINTLTNLVFQFWRIGVPDATKMVAVRDIIIDYFDNVADNRSFEDFYYYVLSNYDEIKKRKTTIDSYFDYDSFVFVCKDFITGGFYENLCKQSELGDRIAEKDFIVFELTQIKKDAFLVDVIMSVLLDVIETKLLDKGTRGILVFDEYAETQQLKDNLGENKIHSTVAFCYQKLRKENSAVWTIIQTPAQLRDDEYSKGMIDNTQILVVLPTTESVYKKIIETFSITDETLIELMKSQRNNFAGEFKNRYSEVYIRMMDLYGVVVRIKLSPERFITFQTDGEMWKELQKEKEKTDIKTAILTLKNKYYEKKNIANF